MREGGKQDERLKAQVSSLPVDFPEGQWRQGVDMELDGLEFGS